MKLDILAFGAHPDDVEISCGATLLKYAKEGKSIGIIDLTEGELGTRGSSEKRYEEANKAAEILGLKIRQNLNMGDGFIAQSEENKLKIIEQGTLLRSSASIFINSRYYKKNKSDPELKRFLAKLV